MGSEAESCADGRSRVAGAMGREGSEGSASNRLNALNRPSPHRCARSASRGRPSNGAEELWSRRIKRGVALLRAFFARGSALGILLILVDAFPGLRGEVSGLSATFYPLRKSSL